MFHHRKYPYWLPCHTLNAFKFYANRFKAPHVRAQPSLTHCSSYRFARVVASLADADQHLTRTPLVVYDKRYDPLQQ